MSPLSNDTLLRVVITALHTMIRKKAHADLDAWLDRAARKVASEPILQAE